MRLITSLFISNKFFASAYLAITIMFSGYTTFPQTLLAFALITSLDTITSINLGAYKKKLKFNPLKAYFWKEIKSGLIRVWMKKVFKEYFIYLIIAFILDILILEKQLYFDFMYFRLNLPIIVLWWAIGIELWSIGENIEGTGKKNWIKIAFKWLENQVRNKLNLKSKKEPNEKNP